MKKLKILVKVPTKRESRWLLSVDGKGHVYRRTADRIFTFIERRLLPHGERIKNRSGVYEVHLCVRYPKSDDYPFGSTNEGVYETVREVLYALACFLEDYLPISFSTKKYKRFQPL